MAGGEPLKKVLVADRFSEDSLLWLKQQNFLNVQVAGSPRLETTEVATIQGLIIRSRTPIDEALLKKAKQLQVIVTATSGFDHIDLAACNRWGITVMHTPDANIESAAQLTWMLVLACAHKIRACRGQIEAGIWQRQEITGMELMGRAYGVVGLGRIGSRVARMAQSFGMNVVAYDPYLEDTAFAHAGARKVSFEELLAESDVLSFHVPKTEETAGLFNANSLPKLARCPILVNTSRGSVTPEKLILEALDRGLIRSVGLDVFETEPLPANSALIQHDRAVLTPHVAGSTDDAFAKASQMAAQKIVHFFLDGSTSDLLPPRAPWYMTSS